MAQSKKKKRLLGLTLSTGGGVRPPAGALLLQWDNEAGIPVFLQWDDDNNHPVHLAWGI